MSENGEGKNANDRSIRDDWISEYKRYAANQESPPAFQEWVGASVIAGALRRNVWLSQDAYHPIYPNMYVLLIAPTGKCRKSTAIRMGVGFLEKLDDPRIVSEKITPEGLISYLQGEGSIKHTIEIGKNNHRKPGVSIEKSAAVKDATEIKYKMSQQCVAFIKASELSVFLGNQSYNTGLIEILTDLYDGDSAWSYITKTKGQIQLYNVNVNLLGASTPEWLSRSLGSDAQAGGFTGRLIPVFQKESVKKIAWPSPTEEQRGMGLLLQADLGRISRLSGEFKVYGDVKEHYRRWYEKEGGVIHDPDFSGYYERKPAHILKLALVLAASRSNEMVILKQDIDRALEMLNDLEPYMPEAFAFVGSTKEAMIARRVLEVVEKAGGTMAHAELYNKMGHLTRNMREYLEIMKSLEGAGKLQMIMEEQGKMRFTTDTGESTVDVDEEDEEEAEAEERKEGKKIIEKPKDKNLSSLLSDVLKRNKAQKGGA